MPKYKIQLSPVAIPFTVGSREALEKVVALFDKMKGKGICAFPYFYTPPTKKAEAIYRKTAPKEKADFFGLARIGWVGNDKQAYRDSLAYAIHYLKALEEYRKGTLPGKEVPLPLMPDYIFDTQEVKETVERITTEAGREAEEVLSLIEEYESVPGEIKRPYYSFSK